MYDAALIPCCLMLVDGYFDVLGGCGRIRVGGVDFFFGPLNAYVFGVFGGVWTLRFLLNVWFWLLGCLLGCLRRLYICFRCGRL